MPNESIYFSGVFKQHRHTFLILTRTEEPVKAGTYPVTGVRYNR